MIPRLACARAGALIDRREAGLADHEQLELEAHLAECEPCAADARLLREVVASVRAGPATSLSTAERRLVLGRALAAERGAAPIDRRPSVTTVVAATVAAVAIAAAVVLAFAGGEDDRRAPRLAATPIAAGVEQLGHARIRASDGARWRWDDAAGVLHLERGRVFADVEPTAGRAFTVSTPELVVRVLGTRFYVDADARTVRVDRGAVRIESREGRVLAARLGPGRPWRDARGDEAAVLVPPAVLGAPEPDVVATVDPPRERDPGRSAAAWLAVARRRLAARDLAAARDSARAALGASPSAPQHADALLVLAECEVAASNTPAAVRAYDRVGREHPDLPAAEIASFAAARLEANAGRAEGARRRLESHLARWPRGRFTREARTRLRAIDGTP